MMPSIDQFIVWIIVGLLGGSLAGLMTTWDRKGLGLLRNLRVGFRSPRWWPAVSGAGACPRAGQSGDLAARCRDRLRRIADRPRGALDLAALSNLPIEAIAPIYNAALN